MRGVAVVVLTLILCPGTVLGQGSQASSGRRALPASFALARMGDLPTVRPGEVTFVFERPESRDFGPLGQGAGAGTARVGMVTGWLVGLAMGPTLFRGRDMGCDDIECYGTINSAESLLAGVAVGGGVGLFLGNIVGLVTDLDTGMLSGLRIKVRPSGKSGLKIKTAVRF